MDVVKTRERISRRLHRINDHTLLSELEETVSQLIECESGKDWWDEMTPQQQERIDKGLADINAGRVTSHEKVKTMKST